MIRSGINFTRGFLFLVRAVFFGTIVSLPLSAIAAALISFYFAGSIFYSPAALISCWVALFFVFVLVSVVSQSTTTSKQEYLQQLEAHLFSQVPLIGKLLQQEAIQTLTKDSSPEAVRLMAMVVARSDNKQVQRGLLKTLQKVSNQTCIDSICEVWAFTRYKELTNLLIKKGWVASTPAKVKVLSTLKVGQLEVVTKGGAEIVEPLLEAFSDADSEIASRASQCAIALKKLEAQEMLCRLVIEQDHQIARQVAINAQYTPRGLNQKALFLFLTEQWDKYESLDFKHTLLQTAYQVGDEQLRQRIAQKVRQAGRVEWVQIIAGGHKGKRLGEMTHEEWETALEILNSGQKWEEMWQLAQAAPPIWSVRLLRQLKDAGRVPKMEFADLVQMGQKCVAVVPDKPNSSWRCHATLHHGHNNLAISPDGKLLIINTGNTVKLWSLPDGKPLQTSTHIVVTCLAISLDSKLLVIGTGNTIKLWSLPDGKPLQTLTGHGDHDHVNYLAISPDGKRLASCSSSFLSGSDGKTVRLWSLPDGKPIQILTGHRYAVECLAISPDSKLLASGSKDETVRLWSLPDGKRLQTLTGHGLIVERLAISPDGKLLASSSIDGTVILWSLPDGKPLQILNKCIVGDFLGISPDSKLLVSGSIDNKSRKWSNIRLWSLPDGKPLRTLTGHSEQINCLCISPDGKLLASGSIDGTIRLWSLPDGKLLQILTGHSGWVNYLGISPDGKLLASSDGKIVRLWTSGLYSLSRLPVEQMSAEDMQWVQEALQDKAISEAERDWLKFIQALVSWRRWFDVEVEEAPQRIDAGEFDIEIEG